jgi:putative hemolysin
MNRRGLREALRWLENGGALGVFPAGEVAHLDMRRRGISDPPWNDTAARLALQTGASVLPVYFAGANGPLFQIAGLMHPRLRTALLPHELLNKRNRAVEMRIGHACPAAPIAELRRRTEWLRLRRQRSFPRPARRMAAVGPGIPETWLASEFESLPGSARLLASSSHDVLLAHAAEIPLGLRELGRLREITFRLAGEGTGHSYDLDSFDERYLHLVLWNRDLQRIDGAYRLARTGSAHPLYTSTLFKFAPGFIERIGPAIELGRSFIRPEAQKNYQALLMLWRGIGVFLSRNPEYRRMFGPVSISPAYRMASRALMARYLAAHHFDAALAALLKPRKPFAPRPSAPWPEPANLDDLDGLVRDIEPDGKGVPVLLRHYLRLNARLAGFNVDPAFGNCLDGLIVVDLDQVPAKQLERFLPRRTAA